MIIVNGWKPVTIITIRSILDVAAALDPPLRSIYYYQDTMCKVSQFNNEHVIYLIF